MDVLRWLDRHVEEVFIVAITIIMTISLFMQVLFRFVINLPLAWTEEVSIFMLVWLCYFGSSLAIRRRKHLRIDIITHFMSPTMQGVFNVVANLCFFIFAAFVLYQLSKLTLDIFTRGQITAVLQMPKWIIYFGVTLSFALSVIRLIQDTVLCIKEIRETPKGGGKERIDAAQGGAE